MPPQDVNPGVPAPGNVEERRRPSSPALGSSVSADLEALRNDVEQARELSSEYQRQLAGKSNEFAHLKDLFEKTTRDFLHLQQGIAQLREERHQLANDAMKAAALELKVRRLTDERDRLEQETVLLRQRAEERERLIDQLIAEAKQLREARGAGSSIEPDPVRAPRPPEAVAATEYIAIPFSDLSGKDKLTVVPTEANSVNAARRLRRQR